MLRKIRSMIKPAVCLGFLVCIYLALRLSINNEKTHELEHTYGVSLDTPPQHSNYQMKPRMCSRQERLDTLQEGCNKYNDTLKSLSKRNQILVDDKHRLVICVPPKVGSSSWLRLLAMSSGDPRGKHSHIHPAQKLRKFGIKPLHSYSAEEIQHIMTNYFKVLVVRHPFDRLVSAWKDKLTATDGSLVLLSKQIAHKYKTYRNELKNVTKGYKIKSSLSYFEEFARYVQETGKLNVHWRHYDLMCSTCLITWDYISKLETTDFDSPEILKHFGSDIDVKTLPQIHSHQASPSNHAQKVLPEFAGLSVWPKVLSGLYQIYQHDLEMFGYSWNQTTLTATCGTERQQCC